MNPKLKSKYINSSTMERMVRANEAKKERVRQEIHSLGDSICGLFDDMFDVLVSEFHSFLETEHLGVQVDRDQAESSTQICETNQVQKEATIISNGIESTSENGTNLDRVDSALTNGQNDQPVVVDNNNQKSNDVTLKFPFFNSKYIKIRIVRPAPNLAQIQKLVSTNCQPLTNESIIQTNGTQPQQPILVRTTQMSQPPQSISTNIQASNEPSNDARMNEPITQRGVDGTFKLIVNNNNNKAHSDHDYAEDSSNFNEDVDNNAQYYHDVPSSDDTSNDQTSPDPNKVQVQLQPNEEDINLPETTQNAAINRSTNTTISSNNTAPNPSVQYSSTNNVRSQNYSSANTNNTTCDYEIINLDDESDYEDDEIQYQDEDEDYEETNGTGSNETNYDETDLNDPDGSASLEGTNSNEPTSSTDVLETVDRPAQALQGSKKRKLIHTFRSEPSSSSNDPQSNSFHIGSRRLSTQDGEPKQFKCSYCEKTFSRGSYLNQHLRIHIGVKPFQCSICKKSFYQQCRLDLHSRIHTNVKLFKCEWPHCTKIFAHAYSLRVHMDKHQGDEDHYKCIYLPDCGYTSRHLYSVKTHIRTQHFRLPPTLKMQNELGIVDDRNASEFVVEI